MIETKFKETEVGRVPADWSEEKIMQKCTIKARIGWQGLTTNEYLPFGDYILVTGTDFDNGYINWNTCNYVSEWRYNQDKNIQLCEGDVLITKDGTIGKVAYLDKVPMPGTLNSGVFVVRLKDKNEIDQTYLSWYFKSIWFISFIDQLTAGSTINHLYQKDFIKFSLILPPLPEQRRIATALSDIDSLISSLDELIEKKRNIKQGTMQQLLTGKTRLNGFSEPWGKKKLGEVGTFIKGSISPSLMPKTIFTEYSMPAFDESKQPKRVEGSTMNSARTPITGDVLLINKLNVRQRRIWLVCQASDNAVCSGEFLPYTSKMLSLDFLKHLLLTDKVVNEWNENSTGTSNSQKRITPTYVLEYRITFPSLSEQRAIASFLASMDDEIAALEQKREKYVSLKQGMMQELLSGRIRLV